MGMFRLFSDDNINNNPNPYNFKILSNLGSNNNLHLLKVHYPDCTTFDGVKIILIKGSLPSKKLDPHFLEDNDIIARFRPTVEGLKLAMYALNYKEL